ncbi:MAG: right-handed parallel beta-helix repeat-containing protein, partial [Proteobacteria bacterium]|nr:right-handed parallel beta-helix repeat-containing protein [Pseudomonadota bacterium]
RGIAAGYGVVLDGLTSSDGYADEEPTAARRIGGGIVNGNCSPLVENCTFSKNIARGGGGMANHDGSSPTVKNCVFSENSTTEFEGGGMQNWADDSDPQIINCLFHKNVAGLYGGGAGMFTTQGSHATVTNCTFSENETKNMGHEQGKGAEVSVGGSMTVINSIFYGSTGRGDEIWVDAEGTASVTYSIVEGGYDGDGNLDEDPLFRNSIDLHLTQGSPAINSGTSNDAPSDDLDGNTRPTGEGVDMGAYEYQP